jgi:hypothetical protein
MGTNRYRERFVSYAQGTYVWHLLFQARELEQALLQAYCLAERQSDQTFDDEAELKDRLGALVATALPAAGAVVRAHALIQPN